jgi:antitoxin ParD1/3/4
MSDYEKASFLLPPDLARSIREAVDGERYVVESDVVIEALRDWEVRQKLRAAKLQHLRGIVQEGLSSGFEPLARDEFEKIKREGRALLADRNAAE